MRDVGLEWDQWACKTRTAAGQLTVRTDVAMYPAWPFVGRTRGVIASPPCQAWSMAGKRLGLLDQPLVHAAVEDLAAGRDTRERLLTACRDERSLLAAEPMRYLYALNTVGEPDWSPWRRCRACCRCGSSTRPSCAGGDSPSGTGSSTPPTSAFRRPEGGR
ncbi:hypothetical protein SHKM778_31360 [Streptomyces sp. KM77-8]|uniref:DNA (cytosine-5-)-methyltransferase n=1 Tax=Streptomyces haneummycinicus TaxID=3074435 RepID=A0AAT9HGY7_9ACTN